MKMLRRTLIATAAALFAAGSAQAAATAQAMGTID